MSADDETPVTPDDEEDVTRRDARRAPAAIDLGRPPARRGRG